MPEIKTTCLCATAALAIVLAAAPAVAWEPTKPVEIVVAAGAGGASDQMARMMQSAIQKNNLMKQPVVVSLKGGASGAEALMYMKSSEGDPNKVLHRLLAHLHAAAVGQDPVQLARSHPGRGDRARSVRAVGEHAAALQIGEGVRRRRQGRHAAVQDGRHRLAARGPRPDRLHGEEDRREVRLPAVQVGRRGRDPAGRQPHRRQRQQSVGESRSLARGPGACAVRVRQGADRVQDQGHRPISRGTTSRPARNKASTSST